MHPHQTRTGPFTCNDTSGLPCDGISARTNVISPGTAGERFVLCTFRNLLRVATPRTTVAKRTSGRRSDGLSAVEWNFCNWSQQPVCQPEEPRRILLFFVASLSIYYLSTENTYLDALIERYDIRVAVSHLLDLSDIVFVIWKVWISLRVRRLEA